MGGTSHFDGDPFEESLMDGDVRAMARRQFSVSVVVGVALVVVAALLAVRAPGVASMETAAHHRIVQPETPRLDTARPSVNDARRG